MIYKISEAIGKQIIIFLGFLLTYSALFILLNSSIHSVIFYLSLVSTILLFLLYKKSNASIINLEKILSIIGFLISIAIAYIVAINFYDFSFDGQWYHLNAIIHLSTEWNPLYDPEFNENGGIWMDHYAMGNWYGGTVFYMALHAIEATKMYGLLIFLASIFLLFSVLNHLKVPAILNVLLTLIATLNPVTLVQLFTNYNDGIIAPMMIVVLCSVYLFLKEKSWYHIVFIFTAITVISNIKFTALGYAIIMTGTPMVYMVISNKPSQWWKVFKEQFMKYVLIVIAAFVFATGFVGMTSYVTNTIDHGHPFYPLAGEGKQDIMTTNKPPELRHLSRLESFTLSIFSPSGDYMYGEKIEKKNLFKIMDSELATIGYADTRVGGFGPLYGLIFIVTLAMFIVSVGVCIKQKDWLIISVMITILMTIVINPEPWWMRYIPQLWALSAVVLIGVVNKFKFSKLLVLIPIALISVNIGIVINGTLSKQNDRQTTLEDAYSVLKEHTKTNDVILDFQWSNGNEQRIIEQGIKYTNVKEYPEDTTVCESNVQLATIPVLVCSPDEELLQKLQK